MKSTIACLLIAFICGTCAASEVYKYTEGDFTMLEQMDLDLEVPYVMKGGSLGSVKMSVVDARVDDEGCSLNSTYAVLRLKFGELEAHNLTQKFKSDGHYFWMEEMTFNILHDMNTFKNAKDDGATFTLTGDGIFNTTVGRSYACDTQMGKQIVQSKQKFNMTFTNMKVQPFGVTGSKFSTGEHCSADPSTESPRTSPTTSATTPSKTTSKTTASKTTSKTTASKTTSKTTPATTASKTTSKTTASKTTSKTTPATTASKTTSPTTKPTPPPKPVQKLNKLNVTDSKGNNCVMEQIEATFTLTANKTKIVVNMTDAVVDLKRSKCGNKTKNESAVLFATFGDLNASTLRQEFAVNNDDEYYYLKCLNLTLIGETDKKEKYNTTLGMVMPNNDTFHVPFGKSLKCDTKQDIKGKTAQAQYNITITFSHVKLQAFDIVKNTFNSTSECAADHAISNIVPIAVGCALAVLVIIVLVAYLIGRRNSSRAGYESV